MKACLTVVHWAVKNNVFTSLPPSTAASTETASRSLRSTLLFCLQRQKGQKKKSVSLKNSTDWKKLLPIFPPHQTWGKYISLISFWEVNETASFGHFWYFWNEADVLCSSALSYNQTTVTSDNCKPSVFPPDSRHILVCTLEGLGLNTQP